MPDVLTDDIGPFLLVAVVLGGGAAWLAGRAVARTWQPFWRALLYMMMLGAVERFLLFALFQGMLLSPSGYALATALAIAFAAAGYWTTRRRQMVRQYGFLRGRG